ncbi:MAG: mismatch repair protein MutT [Lachnospiraceae bacterium]|jgi:8-oxo-dGTP diphosphatase|nr:mismatch repair protein MutT [Anaerocolumna sp.]MDF2610914.1 mismatch repair protein MutT [Lachnospiraceae bacterium]
MDKVIVVAVKSIIVYKRKVLIARRKAGDKYGAGLWEVIGGKLEFGEEPVDALKREIQEETGLKVDIKELLFVSTFLADDSRQIVTLNYVSHSITDRVELSDEHTEYMWAGQNKMRRLLHKKYMSDLEKNHIFEKLYIIED